DFETAIAFIERIGPWNDFEPDVVVEELRNVDGRIPRTFYFEGSPHNGLRNYTISVGREGSPVILLERYEFAETATQSKKCSVIGLSDVRKFPNANAASAIRMHQLPRRQRHTANTERLGGFGGAALMPSSSRRRGAASTSRNGQRSAAR